MHTFDDLFHRLHIFGDDPTAIGHASGNTSDAVNSGTGPAIDSNHGINAAAVCKEAESFFTYLF